MAFRLSKICQGRILGSQACPLSPSALEDLSGEDSGVSSLSLESMDAQPSRNNLPDDPLVETCKYWLEDRCIGGSRDLYGRAIAQAVKVKALWGRFSGGGGSTMPGDAIFRNMLRSAVRQQGGEIDEDEDVTLPACCMSSQSPSLKASCLLFLENFHANLSEAVREKAVDAFEAANGSFFFFFFFFFECKLDYRIELVILQRYTFKRCK